MASYQNTNGYYCGMPANTPQHYPNVYYCNQIPTNFQTHAVAYSPENYNQAVYSGTSSGGSFYHPTHGEIIHNVSNVYGHNPHYNNSQYSSLTQEPVPYPLLHQEPQPQHKNQHMAKRHYAHITILPSSKGTFKAHIKRKRKRTVFTTDQIQALEDIFKRKHYVNREESLELVNQLQLNDKAIKIWFQNRRLKVKRIENENSEENVESYNSNYLEKERSSSVLTTLDSVESRISQNTDERGFVSLDDGVLSDLANVIDDFLTNNSVDGPIEKNVESENGSIYEPISPASVSNGNEEVNSINWRPCEPNESLQILFDLQAMSKYNL